MLLNPTDILEAIHPVGLDWSTPNWFRARRLGLILHRTRPWIVANSHDGWLTHDVAVHWRRYAHAAPAALVIRNYRTDLADTTSIISFLSNQHQTRTTLPTLAIFDLVLTIPLGAHPSVTVAIVDTQRLGNRVALYNSSVTYRPNQT